MLKGVLYLLTGIIRRCSWDAVIGVAPVLVLLMLFLTPF